MAREPEHCPICDLPPNSVGCLANGRDGFLIDCPRCGQYEIAWSAVVTVPHEDPKLRCFLAAHTRQTWDYQGQRATVSTNWHDLAQSHSQTPMALQLGKLMELARHRSVNPGARFGFRPDHDYPLLDAPCTETASFLFKHACDSNLLSQSNMDQVLITFKGWEYLETAAGSPGAPRRAFVAMSFDPQFASAYDDGIKPALEQDCGLTCVRMDRVEHNEKICDKILADIRRCHILVADFTLQRPGVYFEAGFALALNRTVIWTVREDEMNKVHFDTRQYNHVVWKDPRDLRTKLVNRIQAVTPPART